MISSTQARWSECSITGPVKLCHAKHDPAIKLSRPCACLDKSLSALKRSAATPFILCCICVCSGSSVFVACWGTCCVCAVQLIVLSARACASLTLSKRARPGVSAAGSGLASSSHQRLWDCCTVGWSCSVGLKRACIRSKCRCTVCRQQPVNIGRRESCMAAQCLHALYNIEPEADVRRSLAFSA